MNLAVGQVTKPELNVQTRSVYDLIEIAASSVEIPPEDAALGIAGPGLAGPSPFRDDLRTPELVELSLHGCSRRGRHPRLLVLHPGRRRTEQAHVRLLQTLIGMRLVEGTPQTIPTLTIPVSR